MKWMSMKRLSSIVALTLFGGCLASILAQEVITEPKLTLGYGTLEAMAVSADGKHLLTGGSAGAFLWDIESGRVIQDFQSEGGTIGHVAISADGSTAAIVNTRTHVFDIETGTPEGSFPGSWIWGLLAGDPVLSADGTRLLNTERVLAGNTATIRLTDISTGQILQSFQETCTRDCAVAFSHDETEIVAALDVSQWTPQVAILRWSAATGQLLQALDVYPADWCVPVRLSHDGSKLLVGGQIETAFGRFALAEVWDTTTGGLLASYQDPYIDTRVDYCSFTPDAEAGLLYILDYGNDQTDFLLWDLQSDQTLQVFEGGTAPPAPWFTPDGEALFMANGLSVRQYDVETTTVLRSFEGHTSESGGARPLSFTPDGTKAVTAGDGGVQLWDTDSGSLIRIFYSPEDVDWWGDLPYIDVSPDGNLIAAVLFDKVLIWDATTGDHLRTISMQWGRFNPSGVFSPDSSKLLTTRTDDFGAYAEIWDVATGSQVSRIRCGGDFVLHAVFSQDGTKVLTAHSLPPPVCAQLWDANTGQLLRNYESDTGWENYCVAFSPDGSDTVAGGTDGVRVWDVATGDELRTFQHGGRVWSIDISGDGTRLLTTAESDEENVRLWDYETGELLKVIRDPKRPIQSAVLSPDGTKVLTHDSSLRLWGVSEPVILQIARDGTGGVVLTWEDPNYILQQSSDLSSTEWGEVAVITPGRHEVVDPAGMMFYRLASP
jgi:WD40 repeat protein